MEINCFESGEHFGNHMGPFPSILKQFEEIEKNHDFSIFLSFKVKEFMKDLVIFERKKKLKTFFSKITK